ncbi:PEP-CTERM protein-sorting domain-containing protein [Nitrosospira briensis]|uniref:PEP-CTERM protein-sorting domain-containing protein n=2 Tax=Nitrosospira briensis TaxID=35799 RepID=A0A1I4Y4K3_9PROT|nr:PEP-CTERM protein-sorting domain-containing protein [Nitrosospira briensis]
MNRQSLLIAAALFTFTSTSHATKLITFDEISNLSASSVPDNYEGFKWTNFDYVNPFSSTSGFESSGARNGLVSLRYLAVNHGGLPAQFESTTPFTLNSAYFGSAFKDGLQVTVEGQSGGLIVDTKLFTVNATGRNLETFNWQNVDTVLISATGGTRNPLYGSSTSNFTMDNLIVSNVPEPESYAMLLAGLGLVSLMARRRKSSSM